MWIDAIGVCVFVCISNKVFHRSNSPTAWYPSTSIWHNISSPSHTQTHLHTHAHTYTDDAYQMLCKHENMTFNTYIR